MEWELEESVDFSKWTWLDMRTNMRQAGKRMDLPI